MNDARNSLFGLVGVSVAAVAMLVLVFLMSLVAVAVWSYHSTPTNLPPIPRSQPEWLEGVQAGDSIVQPDEVNPQP